MKHKKEFKYFQEYLMNSWPAKHYYFLNGWILRFTEGVTSRANSVFPIQYTGTQKSLNNDIELVEKAYKTHNLETVFMIPDFHEPKKLGQKLLKRGYRAYDHTSTLGIEIENIQTKKVNREFDYHIYNSRITDISDFLVKFSKWNKKEQTIIQELNQRIIIPEKCYIVSRNHDEIIGTLLAILVPQGYMYIGDVFVHPDYRMQGVASSMLVKLIDQWALVNEVRFIWLQVERENVKALNLYHKFGMRTLYNYYYMKRNLFDKSFMAY
ncbi:MAG: GNAT family N-acetyltransferase [Candidatus Thorarchaeota archaeon]